MSKINFKRADIFGKEFQPSSTFAFNKVSYMIFNNIINTVHKPAMKAGTIDLNVGLSLDKVLLWSYIYYLYTYNNETNSIFKSMKRGKANAELFVSRILKYLETDRIDKMALTIFINKIINENNLINPIISNIDSIVKNKQKFIIEFNKNFNSPEIKEHVNRIINKHTPVKQIEYNKSWPNENNKIPSTVSVFNNIDRVLK